LYDIFIVYKNNFASKQAAKVKKKVQLGMMNQELGWLFFIFHHQ